MRLRTRYLDCSRAIARRSADDDRERDEGQQADVDRFARQRRGSRAGAAASRRAARRRDRSNLGARSGQWLFAARLDARAMARARQSIRKRVERRAKASMAQHVRGDARLSRARHPDRSTTATTFARWRKDEGVDDAFDFPGFVPAYIRPLFCRGVGPFRWVALSGDPDDIYRTDAKVKELLPDDAQLHHWLDMARERIRFQGLPARICWVGLGRSPSAWACVQRHGRAWRTLGADRHRPRSSGFRLASPRRIARPKR